jgi:hypothetical protein
MAFFAPKQRLLPKPMPSGSPGRRVTQGIVNPRAFCIPCNKVVMILGEHAAIGHDRAALLVLDDFGQTVILNGEMVGLQGSECQSRLAACVPSRAAT